MNPRFAAVGVLLAISGAAPAQTTLFLQPEAFSSPPAGERRFSLVRVDTSAQAQPEPAPWPGDIKWLLIRSGGEQDNRDRVEPVADASHIVLTMPHPGCAMVGVDFKPVMVTMSGEQLAALITSRTAGAAPDALRESEQVRIRHIRSAKTLIRVSGEAGTPDRGTAVSKSGQQVEIRPFADPTLAPAAGDLPARMYIRGDAAGTARLIATHVPSNDRRDVTGSGTLIIPSLVPGAWRVEFHYAAPVTGDSEADWELHTATVTFEAAEGGR